MRKGNDIHPNAGPLAKLGSKWKSGFLYYRIERETDVNDDHRETHRELFDVIKSKKRENPGIPNIEEQFEEGEN